MKKNAVLCFSVMFIFSILILFGSIAVAKDRPSREDSIRNAYRQILAGADKNGDGKISMDECMSISSDKKKIVKDCKYWDADGNGIITEDEYTKQALKIMR